MLTAGCGNNAAAPEMTDRGNKKNQSDAEVTSAPVSYTHLDVYKRQVYLCAADSTGIDSWICI